MVEQIFDWLLRWGEVIGAIGSILVTGSLAILYYQQKSLLADSFQASHRAKVEVEDVIPTKDAILVDLSNVGNGVATDLELATIGIYTTEDGEVRDGITINRLNRTDRGEPTTAGSLETGEREIPYEARIGLPNIRGGSSAGFTSGIRRLIQENYTVCRVYLYLRYTDFTKEARSEYIRGWEFEPEEGVEDADEYFKKGGKLLFETPEFEPENNQYDISEIETGKERTVI